MQGKEKRGAFVNHTQLNNSALRMLVQCPLQKRKSDTMKVLRGKSTTF